MLVVERGNRIEALLDGLAERVMAPGRDPLAPSCVVVQGPGMERWIAQSLARRFGICANLAFLFPSELLERLFAALPSAVVPPANPRWSAPALLWSVAARLEADRAHPDYAPLARQLDAPDGAWRRVQLAREIAALIDRYVTFRPDWVRDWSRGEGWPEDPETRWQARLVRDLAASLGPGHLADRAQGFVEAVGSGADEARDAALARAFPDRVEVFGVSTLPPLTLAVVEAFAQGRDVHLSLMSPSRGWWADLWREVRDGELAANEGGGPFEPTAVSPPARLLAGLGRLGAELQLVLEERPTLQESAVDRWVEPAETVASDGACEPPSLLARLQAELLDLDEGADADPAARRVRADDDSIRVHLCHGPRRELEVVDAALREAFERDPTLAPEDVIVMAPRIDEIAPDIEAVFGLPVDDPRFVPHRIADRGVFQRSPVADAFRELLDLLGSRAARGELLDWLAREPVRQRVGLDEESVERIAEWAARAGVRFGLDAAHREALGVGAERAHSWAEALDRLALAHAFGPSDALFAGLAPEPLDPFADPAALGALGDLLHHLSAARRQVERPRPVAEWARILRDWLERLFHHGDANAHEHLAIRRALVELAEAAEAAGFDRPIPFEAMGERVAEELASTPAPQAFLAGGVTFCELVPLRAIPFRIVVILGLADDAFPRGGPPPGFDRMARAPRPGDRRPRDDDRYLFLEALLSARDQLILTVPARDLRDGSARPPSIVVSELLDALDEHYTLNEDDTLDEHAAREAATSGEAHAAPSGSGLRDVLVVEHPLHAFSPRCFDPRDDPRLRSRDAEAFAGARARLAARAEGGGALRRFLPLLAEDEPARVGHAEIEGGASPILLLEALIERLGRATRFFAREGLQLRLPAQSDATAELDPVGLGPLERAILGSELLADRLAERTLEEGLRRVAAHPAVPAGLPGRLATRALAREVEELVRIVGSRREGAPAPDHDFVLALESESLGPLRLAGRLDRLYRGGRFDAGFGRLEQRSEIGVWLRHLVLCVCVEEGLAVAPRSVLVGRPPVGARGAGERVVEFARVDDARRLLARAVEWALGAGEVPLPLFPRSSRVYAKHALANRPELAWREANRTLLGGDDGGRTRAESEEDLSYARVWEGRSPLETRGDRFVRHPFDELAEAFFAPLLEAREAAPE